MHSLNMVTKCLFQLIVYLILYLPIYHSFHTFSLMNTSPYIETTIILKSQTELLKYESIDVMFPSCKINIWICPFIWKFYLLHNLWSIICIKIQNSQNCASEKLKNLFIIINLRILGLKTTFTSHTFLRWTFSPWFTWYMVCNIEFFL
jgi:hypothetical protein